MAHRSGLMVSSMLAVIGVVGAVITGAVLLRRRRTNRKSMKSINDESLPKREENVVWRRHLHDLPSDRLALVVDGAYVLAEGIVWCSRSNVLWWVDIEGKRICKMQEGSSPYYSSCKGIPTPLKAYSWEVPMRPGSMALRENRSSSVPLVVSFEDAFSLYNPETGERRPVPGDEGEGAQYTQLPETRLNDGRCDRQGRFLCGGINLNNIDMPLSVWEARVGLYRLDSLEGGVHRILPDTLFRCYNGTCFSPDGATLYCTDSPTREILAFDYDTSKGGSITNRRVIAKITGEGVPDGATVDAEGCLWISIFGEGEVRRYSPKGVLLQTVSIPLAGRATCVAIGGPDLDILFVSTASIGLTDAERMVQHNAGGIFAMRLTDVRGLPEPYYKG